MTEATKGVGVAAGLVAAPAVIATKLVLKTLQRPDVFDPAIPPPCWVAVQLPDRKAIVKAGGQATLEVSIANLGDAAEAYEVEANTPGVTVSAAAFALGPLERRVVALELQVPASAHGALPPIVVTVSGCKTYRFRWLLKAKKFHGGHGCCHGVDIDDRPDHQHHWYDHFYTECGCDHA